MQKNKEKIFELIRYLIVGVLTTVVSLAIYYGLVYTFLNPENVAELQIANVISWIGSVIFAYVTNRLFVFKSKNQNKLKEATSFVGSRVLTLIMDMAIMFIGVTILSQNDKIIKLISQVVIIVANYVFSKLFVFNNKKNEQQKVKKIIINKIYFIFLLIIPVVDFLKALFPTNLYLYGIANLIKGAIFLYFIFTLIKKKKHFYSLFLILGFIGIELLYVYSKNFNILKEMIFLLNTFFLPVVILSSNKEKDEKLNDSFLTKIFFVYLLFFLIPFSINPFIIENNISFLYAKTEIIGILLLLLPITYNTLKKHSNWIAKITGFLLIFIAFYFWNSKILYLSLLLTIAFFIIKDRKNIKKESILIIPLLIITLALSLYSVKDILSNVTQENFDSIILNNRLDNIQTEYNQFQNANIEEQIFGLESMEELTRNKTKVDIVDIFYGIGYLGISIYLVTLCFSLSKLKVKSYYLFSIILGLIMSIISGHILVSASIALWVSVIKNASALDSKKKILLVSNMYPSKKNKHYGSFVKNTYKQLEDLNFQMDKVVMKKHHNKIMKIISYLKFYSVAFYKSIFHSYQFIYVHFVSHSTFPVILGRITCSETKLVCNAHGNDIVPDYEWEEKNVKRSQKVLKYADKIIVPSQYFKEVVHTNYNIDNAKIAVYPSGGVNFNVFKNLEKKTCREELGFQKNIFYIGCVTRLEKDKGWDTLIEALHQLKKEAFMKKTKLVLIGRGQEQEEFHKLVKKYQLEEIIIQKDFVFQEELVKYYHAFDLFIFPTKRKSESLGLVGLEAMASHTFVIACALYGPREYAIDNETALTYLEDKDGRVLASKIKKYWEMAEKDKAKILKKAYIMAQQYDKEKLSTSLQEIFQDKTS